MSEISDITRIILGAAEGAAKLAEAQAKVSVACDLLAVMHRDGGHHTAKVGFAQSCDDAREVRHALVDEMERLKLSVALLKEDRASNAAEVERLRAALEQAPNTEPFAASWWKHVAMPALRGEGEKS